MDANQCQCPAPGFNAIGRGYVAADIVRAMPVERVEETVPLLIPVRRTDKAQEIARCVLF
jgi:hypothetical protein